MSWSRPSLANARPIRERSARRRGARGLAQLVALALALGPVASGCEVDASGDGSDDFGDDESEAAELLSLVRAWPSARCSRQPRTIVDIRPARVGPVAPDTDVTLDVRVQNNDSRGCGSAEFTIVTESDALEPGLSFSDWTSTPIAAGEVGTLRLTVRGAATLEPGVYGVPFRVARLGDQTDLPGAAGRAEYVVGGPPDACEVRTRSELLIRDLSVVEDPVRTRQTGATPGVWTFARLMQDAARSPDDAPALVDALFRSFGIDQTINGFEVRARSDAERFLLKPWSKSADGRLDVTRIPLRLLAIVNRIDQRNLAEGHAGEASLVFGMFNPLDFALGTPTRRTREVDFTVAVEYRLPAQSPEDVLAWARAWHQLTSLPFPSEQYNAALEALTRRITARGALPGAPNDSALLRVRTNDGKLEGTDWQLREFVLSPETGRLVPRAVRRTPDNQLIDTARLARWVNQNAEAILREEHEVPALFEAAPFAAGASQNDDRIWDAPEIEDLELRHRFALQTCNGCHGRETRTDRKHISARHEGQLSNLSPYLTGTVVRDPVTGVERRFAELARRRDDLAELVCGADPVAAAAARPLVAGPLPALGERPTRIGTEGGTLSEQDATSEAAAVAVDP